MKKSVLLLFFFVCMALSSYAQSVVVSPEIAGRNTDIVDITKVELLPNETVLHITATHSPKLWVKFASATVLKDGYSSRTYKLLKCDGYPLDTEYFMPEGRKEFKMYFEPLDQDISRFDFVEGYENGAFRIYGVKIRPDNRNYVIENVHLRPFGGTVQRNPGIQYNRSGGMTIISSPGQTIVIPAEALRKMKKGQNLTIQITE